MDKKNTCRICGAEIPHCCVIGWKLIACSWEHYQQFLQQKKGEKDLKTLIRVVRADGKTDNITEYNFTTGEFKGEAKTYKTDEIATFIIPKEEIVNIFGVKEEAVKVETDESVEEFSAKKSKRR